MLHGRSADGFALDSSGRPVQVFRDAEGRLVDAAGRFVDAPKAQARLIAALPTPGRLESPEPGPWVPRWWAPQDTPATAPHVLRAPVRRWSPWSGWRCVCPLHGRRVVRHALTGRWACPGGFPRQPMRHNLVGRRQPPEDLVLYQSPDELRVTSVRRCVGAELFGRTSPAVSA